MRLWASAGLPLFSALGWSWRMEDSAGGVMQTPTYLKVSMDFKNALDWGQNAHSHAGHSTLAS